MRQRIRSPELKEWFARAWAVLPAYTQKQLRSFIRYVDEVEVLEDVFIYGRCEPGGAVEIIAGPINGGTGYAALMTLDSRDVVDIILPSDPLASCDEAAALLIILHELAHAIDYLTNQQAAIDRSWYLSEYRAWRQAREWSSRSDLPAGLKMEIELHSWQATLRDIEEEIERRYRKQSAASLFSKACLGQAEPRLVHPERYTM